jgi:ABC-2 type transport system ATP-binding protein
VGQIGPHGFFDAFLRPLGDEATPPAARPPDANDRTDPRLFVRLRGTSPLGALSASTWSTIVTATLTPQLKNGTLGPVFVPELVPTTVRSAMPALLIEDVSKRFIVGRKRKPVTAISHVSMRLERGDIHGILGANGSGKSTLIRLISGLLTLDEGRVEVFGHDIERDEMAVKRLINRVSVDAAFFKKLSPMENLLFAARLYGLDGRTAKRETLEILARLGISEKRVGRPIEQMSRGMQQKVSIARALLTSPTLLLLDEPTTGLDPRSKLDVQSFIEELRTSHDATIVLTTHDLAEAERLCGRITILNDGRVVAEDTPEGLIALTATRLGRPATLEDVFMTYTGRSLDDDIEDEDAETDDE